MKSSNNITHSTRNKLHSLDQTIKFPKNGISNDHVKEELKLKLSSDINYKNGKVLGAMSSYPHYIAKELYSSYIDRNLGDRGINPATSHLEHEVIQMLADLLNGNQLSGNITSGGTESNIIAMYIAKTNHKNTKHPNIIVPSSAHYSFTKASLLMGVELRKIPLNSKYQVNTDQMLESIDDNTIALVGIAGTSALGTVDPLKSIAEIAIDYNLHFHVDGAFGGLVLPYLDALGEYSGPQYDFRIEGIDSYSIDPHKMGFNVNPTGALLINPERIEIPKFKIPYLAGGGVESVNILGTRPGASVISYWGLIKSLGFTGFTNIIKECWNNTIFAYKEAQRNQFIETVKEPSMNILGIRPSHNAKVHLKLFNSILRKNGWALGYFEDEALLRLVMMPHVTRFDMESFFSFINQSLGE